jgi:hypothetical protein
MSTDKHALVTITRTMEIDILEAYLHHTPTALISRKHGISARRLNTILDRRGGPSRDREIMRRAIARLNREIATHGDAQPHPDDHPAIHQALQIVRETRNLTNQQITAITTRCDPTEIAALLTAFAVLLNPAVDIEAATEWIDVHPAQWSEATVSAEAARWHAGARDRTAAAAHDRQAAPAKPSADPAHKTRRTPAATTVHPTATG